MPKGKNEMRTSIKEKAATVILSLLTMFFIISLSVILTLNFRPLYYFDIDYLNIAESSGYSEEVIRENYDVLIDYNSVFNKDELKFPSLMMSENGKIHFEEVKNIFVVFEKAFFVSAVLGLLGSIWSFRKKRYDFLKLTSIFTIVIPGILALFIGMNWEQAFVTFHEIFFDNDYWIFDPAKDPVITILPDEFFFHCAAMILAGVVLGSIFCIFTYHVLKKESRGEFDGFSNTDEDAGTFNKTTKR